MEKAYNEKIYDLLVAAGYVGSLSDMIFQKQNNTTPPTPTGGVFTSAFTGAFT